MNHKLIGSRTSPVNQSVLGCHLSLKGTLWSLTSGSCAAPPSHMPRAGERNEEHVHTGKQIYGFRSQQSCGSKKPQEVKIRTLWAICVFVRADQYSFLSVGYFTYTLEKSTSHRGEAFAA